MNNNKKGQGAIIGLLLAFVLIAIYSILQGPLMSFIDIGVNQTDPNVTNGELIITVMRLLPVIMAIVILIAIVALITGRVG